MSYTLPETLGLLTWEERPGLEVQVLLSPVAMGDYFDWHTSFVRVGRSRFISEQAEWLGLADRWAPKFLRSWSLPEPATAEGLHAQPLELVVAILTGWDRGVAEVPVPLAVASSLRATAAETSLPSSARPSSSTTP